MSALGFRNLCSVTDDLFKNRKFYFTKGKYVEKVVQGLPGQWASVRENDDFRGLHAM